MAKVIVRKVTYLGQRAEVKEIREAGADGEREYRTRWIDPAIGQPVEYPAGTITSHTVTGNMRRGTFRTLIPQHVVTEF